jgi:hypothetical protein
MTESERLESTDPNAMLKFLLGKTTQRKLRLFAVACCRRIWSQMIDARSHQAVELAERSADEPVSDKDLDAVSAGAEEAFENSLTDDAGKAVSDDDPRPTPRVGGCWDRNTSACSWTEPLRHLLPVSPMKRPLRWRSFAISSGTRSTR